MSAITLERLERVKNVYYHASCPDGAASALIIFMALRKIHDKHLDVMTHMPEFRSVQYHTERFETLAAGPDHLFVDITPPRDRWREWLPFDPIVLDHHESVEDVVRELGGVYATNENHSGARLAFEQVMMLVASEPGLASVDKGRNGDDDWEVVGPDLAFWDEFSRIAMIRDTWKDKNPDFERATVQAYGLMDLGAGELLAQVREKRFDPKLITMLGERDLGKAKFMAESAKRYVLPCPKLGRDLVTYIYNCTEKKYISDGCHFLLNRDADFAISYFYKTENDRTQAVVSLRTNDPIASKIAKAMGGGGHDKAAGFGLPNGEAISMDAIIAVVQAQLAALQ